MARSKRCALTPLSEQLACKLKFRSLFTSLSLQHYNCFTKSSAVQLPFKLTCKKIIMGSVECLLDVLSMTCWSLRATPERKYEQRGDIRLDHLLGVRPSDFGQEPSSWRL